MKLREMEANWGALSGRAGELTGASLEALAQRFPLPTDHQKTCMECEQALARHFFTATEWAKAKPTCMECKPVDEQLRKRLMTCKTCCMCHKDLDRSAFSDTQWRRGSASKCAACVTVEQVSCKINVKRCKTCNEDKPQQDYTRTQWEALKKVGSQCSQCCKEKVAKHQFQA